MNIKKSYYFVSVPKGSGRETPSSPRRKLGSKGVSRPLPLNTEIMLKIVFIVLILHSYPCHGGGWETPSSPRRKLGSKGVSRPLPLNTEIMLIIVYVVSILHSYPRHSSWEQFRSEECISPINMRGLTHL